MAQRNDLDLFATGISDLLAGIDSNESVAASQNIADVLRLMAMSVTDNKWADG
jgi:hypothetical protein